MPSETNTITLYPSSFDNDYKAYSVSGTSLILNRAESTSRYATVNLTRGSNAETYAYWNFDASSIPENAIIDSVSCSTIVYISSVTNTRISTRLVQLYSGTTAKGSSSSITRNTSTMLLTTGDWTREELQNVRIRVYAVRGTRNTNTNYYIRFYGASLIITYTISGVLYTLEVQSNGFNVTPSESTIYNDGSSVVINIGEENLPKVTLNGVDITNNFVQQELSTSYSNAPTNSSYSGVQSSTSYVDDAVGYTAENPNSVTQNWYGSSSATVDSLYALYTFDLSSIPEEALNIQVTCKVAGKAESSTYSHLSGGRYSVWGLCCNGTAKGELNYTTNTSTTVIELNNTGSWTREELNGLQLRHYVGYYGGTTNGATLTVTYALANNKIYTYTFTINLDSVLILHKSDSKLYIKRNNTWVLIQNIYKKIDGVWERIDNAQSLFENISDNTNSGFYVDI